MELFHATYSSPINRESQSKTGKNTKTLRCADCDETFPGGLRALARHLYAHTFVKRAPADLTQICSDCEGEFGSRAEAERHLADKDNKCRNAPKAVYPCAICRGREGDDLFMLRETL